MPRSALIIAPATAANAAADELRKSLDLAVEMTHDRRAGIVKLRRKEYALVFLDESITTDPSTTETFYQTAGGASVIECNFALTPPVRLVRIARSALHRRQLERERTRVAVTQHIRAELNTTLTGILLGSELLLHDAPPQFVPKVRQLVQLAGDLRDRLRP